MVAGLTGVALTDTADAAGHNVRPSIEVTTVCTPDGGVTVTVTDETNDDGAAVVGAVDIACQANVKAGRGKPQSVNFGNVNIPGPVFDLGVITIETSCPLGNLPAGANDWKATATASGGNLRKSVSDTCEDQFVADPD
jgi:hypothetical protein